MADDSLAEIVDPMTSIQANTECVGECRIGAVAPDVGHAGRVGKGRAEDFMAASSRDRISVDLRGLKVALLARSRAQGQTPSDFVRALLATALDAEGDEPRSAREPVQSGPRIRLSLRMSRDEARLVIDRARAAGLSIGAYVADLCAGIPAIVGGARPADQIASLVRSSAELATLARDLRHLTQLLRHGEVRAAQEYRRLFDTLGDDVRAHLQLAARALADLRPARQVQQGDSHARTP